LKTHITNPVTPNSITSKYFALLVTTWKYLYNSDIIATTINDDEDDKNNKLLR